MKLDVIAFFTRTRGSCTISKSRKHIVANVTDLPPGSRSVVSIGRIEIVLFNVNGDLFGLRNSCPHRGGPFSCGHINKLVLSDTPGTFDVRDDQHVINCPWHSWEFRLSDGVSLTDPNLRVKTYPVTADNEKILVEL